MANTIKIKRSAVQGKVPLTTDLALGELALNTYDGKLYTKKDNGTASIVELSGGAGVTDGDKGDITVSASGATWTIDNDAVTYAKLQNVTSSRLLGRSSAGAGDAEEISVGTGLSLSAGTLSATGGSGTYTVSATAPGSPSAGDRWLDSDSGIEYTYVNDGTSSQWVELGAPGLVGSGGGGVLRVTFHAGASFTWTNMPSAATILAGSTAYIQEANLANYTECRLLVNKTGVAGATGSTLELQYSTTYTQTAGSYATIGVAAASVAVNVADQYLDSGWKTLVTGARGEVYLSVIGAGGNANADPTFGLIVAEFR